MTTVKCYKNTSDKDLNVIGIGIIPAGEQVSLHTEYQPPVILENYPGLIDVTELTEVQEETEVAAEVSLEAPQEAPQNTLETTDTPLLDKEL